MDYVSNFEKKTPLINILTRTGSRKKDFELLNNSINEQTYKNIRHIKSNDNPNCSFLNNETDIIDVLKCKTLGSGFYNLYLNKLISEVNDGWIIILDDDSKLIDNSFIERLANECENLNENEVLIYQVLAWPQKCTLPSNGIIKQKKILFKNIDMACFCGHHSLLKKYNFTAQEGGDYKYLKLIEENDDVKFKFISMKPGIWANCKGGRHGK
jgi:hypothetical protein